MNLLNYIDDRALVLLNAICLISIALVSTIYYSMYKKDYFRYLIYGFLMNGLGFLFVLLRGQLPDIITVVVSNILLILGSYLVLDAMVQMVNEKSNLKFFIGLVSLFALVHTFFLTVQPNLMIRIVNYSIFMIVGYIYLIYNYSKKIVTQLNSVLLIIVVTHFFNIMVDALRIYDSISGKVSFNLFNDARSIKLVTMYGIFMSFVRIVSVMLYSAKNTT